MIYHEIQAKAEDTEEITIRDIMISDAGSIEAPVHV